MLTEYVNAALNHATYELLPDGTGYFGAIPELPGVWANADTPEETREELREAVEGWLALALQRGIPIPAIDGASPLFRVA